jgi:uncharacterized OsmC-like protein
MTADELKAVQGPIKARYREDPAAAVVSMTAAGDIADSTISCRVKTFAGPIDAGLHPAAGGDGSWACSGEMLLEALVACAGVTLKAVATAMAIPLRAARVCAEGELDFRGTLGVDRETPVGFRSLRLTFQIESDAPPEQTEKLVQLTERYCVIYQTLKNPPPVVAARTSPGE